MYLFMNCHLEVSCLCSLLPSFLFPCHLYSSRSPGPRPSLSLLRCLPSPEVASCSSLGDGRGKTSCSGRWLHPLCGLAAPSGSAMPIGGRLNLSRQVGGAPRGGRQRGGLVHASLAGWGQLGLDGGHGDFGIGIRNCHCGGGEFSVSGVGRGCSFCKGSLQQLWRGLRWSWQL